MLDVWFWQTIVSPHMAGLAAELSRAGCAVTYVAQEQITADRRELGWHAPSLGGGRLLMAPNEARVAEHVAQASPDSVHVCQGFRGNGIVGSAQSQLRALGMRQWVVMETVDDAGPLGWVKRLEYQRLIRHRQSSIEGVLATGYKTSDWLVARGMEPSRVFPFAYFLPDLSSDAVTTGAPAPMFRFLYVGQLIARKRVDLLIAALSRVAACEFELWVVGNGPEMAALQQQACRLLPGRVHFRGAVPSTDMPSVMAAADCLVLPSRHDGWGAVVSEALMVGTPAVCSDACGAAGVVHASRVGGVFLSGSVEALVVQLSSVLARGKVSDSLRQEVSAWAGALGARAGAHYLLSILAHVAADAARPRAPWLAKEASCVA